MGYASNLINFCFLKLWRDWSSGLPIPKAVGTKALATQPGVKIYKHPSWLLQNYFQSNKC